MPNSSTPNLGLVLTPENSSGVTFKSWRQDINGETNSNMTKIDQKFGNVDTELTALKTFQTKTYGVKFTGSSPTGTRLGDAVGKVSAVGVDDTAVTNDFDSIYPWSKMRRCNGSYNANADFVVSAYKGEPDYKEDGTNGNVWVEIPLFYIKEVRDGNYDEEKYITPYELDGYRVPEKFKKLDGSIRPKVYVSAYESGKVGNAPVSISGVDISAPLWSHNSFMTAARTYVGQNYGAFTFEDYEIYSFLMQIEFATRNVQSIMAGCTNLPTTAVDCTEASTNANYVVVASTAAYQVNYPIKLHTSANSADGDYHEITAREILYSAAPAEYDSTVTYYTRSGDAEPYTYTAYTYVDTETWTTDQPTLFYRNGNVKLTLEADASVTATTSTKVYGCPFISGKTDSVVASVGAYKANNGYYPIIYRGIENPWGNVYKWMGSVLINEYVPYISKDLKDVPVNSSATSITDNMTALDYNICSTNGVYCKALGYDDDYPHVRITTEGGASTSTYYSDYFGVDSGVRAVRFGGYCAFGSNAGLFLFVCDYSPSGTSWSVSSRLSYTG